MKRLKKTLAVILTLCMMMSCVSVTAFATGTDASEKDQTATEETNVSEDANTSEDANMSENVNASEDANTSEDANKEAVVSSDSEEENDEVTLEDKWLHPQSSGVRTTSNTDDFFKITFLDCGRKYFSVDSIKKIIDNAAAAGFNYIQLAVGNDGLRFLLNDMSITVNGTTYENKAVSDAIHAGNEKYYNFPKDELTEPEMDTIIAYAQSRGLGVIPCINSPGHMDAILSAANSLTGETCSYNKSVRTIDVTNNTAVAFTRALIQKYITYFAGKGCQYFNIGADEYANDIYTGGSMGFGNLQSAGNYSYYVQYVNQMAAAIKGSGMTPMAFNDGIYFANNISSGTFDTDIIVCYWSNGWSSYTPMPATTLASMGFKLINTHGDYYWVLGNPEWQCNAEKASRFNYKVFQGGTIDNPAGAMFCIWCDYPGAGKEDNVVSSTAATIDAFGKTLPSNTSNGGTTEPTKPTEKTITVNVGGTTTETIEGKDCSGPYPTEDSSIATVNGEKKEIPGSITRILGSKISSVENEQYIISDGNGNYIKRNDTSIENTTDINEATIWAVSKSGDNITLKDGSYYLNPIYNQIDKGLNINTSSKGSWSYDQSGMYYNSIIGKYYLNNTKGWNVKLRSSNRGNLYSFTTQTTASTFNTEVTFTGVKSGTTYVTIDGIKYTINVVDAAPSDALTSDSIDIEYWITNNKVYDDTNKTNQKVTINKNEAPSDEGVAVDSKAQNAAYSFLDGTVTVYYWQAVRLDATHKQTDKAGVDQTTNGTTITHIRYSNAWQYKTKDGKWHYFKSDDQLVAYYLQKTEVTKEIETSVKDWGYGTNATTPDTSGNAGQVALTVAVVYPDGTVSPTEDKMYAQSTTIFNYWDGRNIGIVAPTNNSDYDISKITVTDGVRKDNSSANQWYTNDSINWNKKETEAGTKWYDETMVWDETENAGTTPMVNGEASGIKWSAKNTAKLVLIYLKPVEKNTNLNVVYYDDAYKKEITRSQIVMKFNQGEVEPTFVNSLKNSGTVTAGSDINLTDNAYVTNSSGINQTFNKDVTTIPNVAAQYKSGLYKYIKANVSEDGKTLTLHYDINNEKLDKSYVIDYGLKLQIPISDLVKDDSISGIQVGFGNISNGSAEYKNGTITYTPDKVLTGVVTIPVKISYSGKSYQTINVAVYPATTVNYEEGFATYDGNWTGASKGTGTQTKAILGQDANNYGYDGAYANTAAELNGTQATSNKKLDKATFDFTGTGVDILANTTTSSGYLTIKITNKDSDKVEKIAIVDTKMAGNSTAGAANGYSVPVYSDTDLAYGNYTVSITHSINADTVNIDGFRVYNTNEDSSIYKADYEDNPNFLEVRDLQFGDITDIGSYGVDGRKVYAIGEQVYKDLTADTTKAQAAITVNGQVNKDNQKELLENGPKNEVYLAKGSAITMTFNTQREVQLGLKGVDGQASYTIDDGQNSSPGTASTLDMFYTIKGKTDSADNKKTITITNTGEKVLSITKLKVCDDPNALQTISADSMTSALYAWGFTDPVPMADATANLNLVDYTGKTIASTSLTANGEQGTDATFTADQIKSAVTSALPEGYAVVDASKIADQTVKYGESADVNVQIGKVATLKVTYKKLFGKTVGTATLTGVQTSAGSKYSFSASEIKKAVPSGYWTIKLWGTKVKYGTTGTLTVNVF